MVTALLVGLVVGFVLAIPVSALAQEPNTYRVMATNKTSTMQKEMQEAGDAGFRFAAVMGGETAMGGKEVVIVMQRTGPSTKKYEFRLLATNKTSTMQKELQEAGEAGFLMIGMTVGKTLGGGNEVVSILRRPVRQ